MKTRNLFFGGITLPFAGILFFSGPAMADIRIKQNNATTIDLAGSWDALPGASDIALWNNLAGAAGNTVGVGAGLNVGAIQLTNPTGNVTLNTGSGPLTLAGVAINGIASVGIDLSSATANLTINAPVTLGSNQTWLVGTGRTLTLNGGIGGGSNGVTLQGLGNFAVSASVANTFTGTFALNGTSTTFTNSATVLNNIFSSSSTLSLSSGYLRQNNINNAGGHSQTFAGTVVNAGTSQVQNVRTSGGIPQLFLGTVTRPTVGGTVNFNMSSASGAAGIKSTNTGMIGGWAVWGQNRGINDPLDFANGNGAALMTGVSHTGGINTFGAGLNTDVTASFAVGAGVNTQSLRFGAASVSTITLGGASQITSGGILVNSTVAANNQLITGGSISGATGSDLIIYQNSSAAAGGSGTLRIDSTITDATSATALTKAGTGTLILGGANTFSGGVYINSGEIRLATGGSLNSNAVTFTNGNVTNALTQVLALNGNDSTVAGLSTTAVVGTGSAVPTVRNASATAASLTVNSATANTFAGSLTDGSGGGALGLVKTGAGTLTLSGANTATGAVSITGGTLALTGSTGLSATNISIGSSGTLDVTGRSGGTLGLGASQILSGPGTVAGALTTSSGTTFNPGGTGSIGTLTLGSLSLSTGSALNFELPAAGLVSDQISIATSGGLVLAGTGIVINLSTTGGAAFASGIGNTYNLFSYSGALSGAGTGGGNLLANTFSVGNAVGGLTYTFANTGSFISVQIGGSLATDSTWQVGGVNNSWNTPGNWTGGVVLQAAGDTARLGNAIGATPTTIGLDGNKSLALLEFNHSAAAYTVSSGTGGTLTLDNGLSVAQVNVLAGSHAIAAPVTLASNGAVSVSAGDTLTLSAAVDGGGSLTKSGAGTLALDAANSYLGGTSINAGTLSFVTGALGSTGGIGFGGGVLKYATGNTEDLSARALTFSGQAQIDTNGNDVSYASPVGNNGSGGLTKLGAGTLSLAAGNTYSGANQIAAGTLAIAADSSLGPVPVSPSVNLTLNGGATLRAGAAISLNANRSLVLNAGTATIDTNGNAVSVGGSLSGAGILAKTGVGNLTLNGAGTHLRTVVEAGTLVVGNNAALGTGSVTLNGTGSLNLGARNLGNDLVVNGSANVLTSGDGGGQSALNKVTGAGRLEVFNNGGNVDLRGDMTAFSGTIANTNGGNLRIFGSAGSSLATFDLGTGGTNVRSNATSFAIGALTGASTSTLGGSTANAVTLTYTIGAAASSTFAGNIANGGFAGAVTALTKAGSTTTLTLTGANTYSGKTTISEGTLALGTGGSIANSTEIALNSGNFNVSALASYTLGATQKLTGSGIVTGNLQMDGDLAIGNSAGTATFNGNLSLTGASEFFFELLGGGTSADLADVNGTLNILGSTLTLSQLAGGVYTANDKFTLFAYDALDIGFTGFSGLADGAQFTQAGGVWEIDYNDLSAGSNGGSGAAFVTITAIPEPASAAIGALGLLALFRRRRS